MSSNESFTLIVVPDRHDEVKRFHLKKRWLFQAAGVVLVILNRPKTFRVDPTAKAEPGVAATEYDTQLLVAAFQ